MQPGQIHEHVINIGNRYQVTRLISRTDKTYTTETIEAIKPPFDVWLNEISATLPISIIDDGLAATIKKSHHNASWVKRLQ